MVNYLLLILSAGLFSSSFWFKKLFQRNSGSNVNTSFQLVFYGSIVTCISMYIIGGFKLEITPFSLIIAFIYAVNNFILTFMGLKAFKYANLSVYSVFIMLGSVILPSIFGIIFYKEELNLTKILCYALIFLSLYFSITKGESNKRAIKYYFAVFVGNGMAGILSKIHQSNESLRVPTQSFLLQSGLIRLLVCIVVLIILRIKSKENSFSLKGAGFALGSGLLNSIGNYFNLFVLISIPITVHSILTTGLTLVFSAVITFLSRERLTQKNIISLILALAATVLSAYM